MVRTGGRWKRTRLAGHLASGLPVYRVERRGRGKDFGHAGWSVGSRELRQPRTEADGKSVTESNVSLRAARANTRRSVRVRRMLRAIGVGTQNVLIWYDTIERGRGRADSPSRAVPMSRSVFGRVHDLSRNIRLIRCCVQARVPCGDSRA